MKFGLTMNGDGLRTFEHVPAGNKFIVLYNTSDYKIDVYEGQTENVANKLGMCPPLTFVNLPLPDGNTPKEITLVWTGTKEDRIQGEFSPHALPVGQSLTGPSGFNLVGLQSDNVGLTKADQLPAALGAAGGLKTEILGTPSMQLSGRTPKKVATHNAVSITQSGNSYSSWQPCAGYDKVVVDLVNDVSFSCSVYVQWSNDGITTIAEENPITNGARKYGKATVDVGADYFRVQFVSADAGASHTISTNCYIKP